MDIPLNIECVCLYGDDTDNDDDVSMTVCLLFLFGRLLCHFKFNRATHTKPNTPNEWLEWN